ncbi:MAG: sigma 54-interacting transcriptional regulator [Bacillota bacterium]
MSPFRPRPAHEVPAILVVEDDEALLQAIETALSKTYRVLVAGDSQTANTLLDREPVSLVLLDLILPRGTGINILEHLMQQPEEAPPVVVMSALGNQVDLSAYGKVMAGKLNKPFGLQQLKQAVREVLQGRTITRDLMPSLKGSVLLVDDDADLLDSLVPYLEKAGYSVLGVASGEAALRALSSHRFDAAVVDWIMPGLTGIDLISQMKALVPGLPVILMTGYGTPSFLRAAVMASAADVLAKPFPPQALPIALEKCLNQHGRVAVQAPARHNSQKALRPVQKSGALDRILGHSIVIERARQMLTQAAATDSNVLILGATGTGKELFSRGLHQLSSRSSAPFVVVNAATIPETLLESELFGYEGGAFTGAKREGRVGKFLQANGGTLFLDEIGDLPLNLQAKLLRVLQEGEIEVVGGSTRRVDVRIVAATHQDLPAMVQRGSFRRDLFYRLNVVTIHLPSLRERVEDIPILAKQFLAELCERYARPVVSLSNEAMQLLCSYSWPGNVRELRNAVERAFVFAQGQVILPVHLPPEVREAAGRTAHKQRSPLLDIATQERETILRALDACNGNKVQAAKLLGISRAGLYLKLKAYGL